MPFSGCPSRLTNQALRTQRKNTLTSTHNLSIPVFLPQRNSVLPTTGSLSLHPSTRIKFFALPAIHDTASHRNPVLCTTTFLVFQFASRLLVVHSHPVIFVADFECIHLPCI